MPSAQTLERFIAMVQGNDHAQACELFYTEHSTMQENQGTPRVGRDAHVANERAVMARAESVTSTCVPPVLVDGDHVVLRWIFHFTWRDGSVTHMEELAWQRWEGERIAEETFFYDPAQRVPRRV
jgi:ketosteroid isomerase-like protein